MELSILNLFLVAGAGLASVLSPCVLPVVPIVVTGTADDHRHRPLFIVGGLSLTFIGMGIISSLFGALIGGKMIYLERIAGAVIVVFGALMLFGVNIFKHLTFFNRFGSKSGGRFGGFLLGLTLGVVWIPCVGPMLSSVLAVVATRGQVGSGVFMLAIYSIGFSIPMLIAAYATQFFRKRSTVVKSRPWLFNVISGTVLIAFGVFVMTKGIMGFGL